MEMGVFAIYDSKIEQYMEPWLSHTDASAERAFRELCQDKSRPPAQHPEDFYLFRVGSWSAADGKLSGEVPKNLLWAAAAVRRQEMDPVIDPNLKVVPNA